MTVEVANVVAEAALHPKGDAKHQNQNPSNATAAAKKSRESERRRRRRKQKKNNKASQRAANGGDDSDAEDDSGVDNGKENADPQKVSPISSSFIDLPVIRLCCGYKER